MRTPLGKLIYDARKLKKLTQEELGRRIGCGKGSISQWENGFVKKIDSNNLLPLSKELELDLNLLLSLNNVNPLQQESIVVNSDNLDFIEGELVFNALPGPDITGRIPLISWVQAGNWSEAVDNYAPGDAEEWRVTTAKCGKHAYALRVVGDSMTNPHGSPSIPDGYIVVVDPDKAPKHNDIVIARLDDSAEATIKRLVIEGNVRYLKPLNPTYPIIHINGNCTICGVVVKIEYDL